MRKLHSTSEFNSQRSECLLRNFRQSLAVQSRISMARAFRDAAEAPAPRFWVSEARATHIITQILKGVDLLEGMMPQKRKMYEEILRRVKETMDVSPSTPVGDIVFNIVNSPAPSSYMTPDRAYRLIYHYKKSLK